MEVVVFESRSLIGNLAIRTEWYSGVFAHDKCNMPIFPNRPLPGRIITRSDGRVVFSGSGPGQISLGIAVLPARQQKCGVE
jgi:hypothetical protein